MLAIQKRAQVVSKRLTLPNGKEVLAFFLVSEVNGQFKASLLSFRPISDSKTSPVFALPSGIAASVINLNQKVRSPYFFKTYKDFSFLTAQLTRAPSYR